MKPEISILMANNNKAHYVGQAIESVLAQTDGRWELIVVDDCSSDRSWEVIRDYVRKDNRISVYKNETNGGCIAVQKRLAEKANAPILLILDSDDTISPETISEVLFAYRDHPDCGYVYSQCWYCDEDLNPRHLGYSMKVPAGKTNLDANCVVAVRSFAKAAYAKTAGYDERMRFAEDYDLTLKLEEVTGLHYIDKPLYYYRILKKSQTHGLKNELINRSSSAWARLDAQRRRQTAGQPGLGRAEMSENLFWGFMSALACGRWGLAKLFAREMRKHDAWFWLKPRFYGLALRKIVKIAKMKISKSA